MTEFDKFVNEQIVTSVDKWFVDQFNNAFGAYYAYFLQGQESIVITDVDPGHGWQLVTPRRISPAWTKQDAIYVIREACWKLPVLKPC